MGRLPGFPTAITRRDSLSMMPFRIPVFMSSRSFDGARAGYVFKSGDRGLGYYRDVREDELRLCGGHALSTEIVALWQAGSVCDVHVVVDGEDFYCHRLVLASCSEYFHLRFTSSALATFKDANGPVHMEEFSAPVFAAALKFFYEGEADVSIDLLQPLLLAASRLQATRLLDSCVHAASTLVTMENCEDILKLAEAISRADLAAVAALILAEVVATRLVRPPPPSRAGDSLNLHNFEFIARVMRECGPTSAVVALSGCHALKGIPMACVDPQIFRQSGAVPAIIAVMGSPKCPTEVAEAACETLLAIAGFLEGGERVVTDAGGIAAVVLAMEEHSATYLTKGQVELDMQAWDTAELGGSCNLSCLQLPYIMDCACRVFDYVSRDESCHASLVKAGVPAILRTALSGFELRDARLAPKLSTLSLLLEL